MALCLPLLVLCLSALVQAGVLVSDQTRLWHGAREAARTAVVDPNPVAISESAGRSGLKPLSMTVRPPVPYRSQGQPLTVALMYRPRSIIPWLSPLLNNLQLHASATMRIEQP